MRIRFKKWARPELEESPFYEDNPENFKNKWRSKFLKEAELHVELGCGKGGFVAQAATKYPENNYMAIDITDAMLGLAKRNVEKAFGIRTTIDKEEIENEVEKEKAVKNVMLVRYDIARILDIFGEEDKIDRIYINFCNPWPKAKHNKRRLTHTVQLIQYKKILKPGGKIYFKTDDDGLFKDSLEYFKESGFELEKTTYDLASEDNFWGDIENIKTEHENMFEQDGIKIKALIAVSK